MEQRIKYPLPAPTDSYDRLFDLVDRVMKRHPGKAKPRRNIDRCSRNLGPGSESPKLDSSALRPFPGT
jgi:hypothetical protein